MAPSPPTLARETSPAEPPLDGVIVHEWSPEKACFSIPEDIEGRRAIHAWLLLFGGGSLSFLTLLSGLFLAFSTAGLEGLVVLGLLAAVVIAVCVGVYRRGLWETAPVSIAITDDTVAVVRSWFGTTETQSYPVEADLVVDWILEGQSSNDGDTRRWHLELVGSNWRVPFGEALSPPQQQVLVERLRIHIGQTLRRRCPRCDAVLTVTQIDRATGRQRCSECAWSSRGRQPNSVRGPAGDLLLPAVPPGLLRIQHSEPELLMLQWGAGLKSWLVLAAYLLIVGIAVFGLFTMAIWMAIEKRQDPMSVIQSLWLLGIGVGMIVVTVLYWHRHYRQTITVTAHRARREIEVERSVSGVPIRQRIALDGGGYVSWTKPRPAVALGSESLLCAAELMDDDLYLVDGPTQTAVGIGRRLSRAERRWLLVMLNRILGTPQFCLPDGTPYPTNCPVCDARLSPAHVSTQSGAICCPGNPRCLWNSAQTAIDPGDAGRMKAAQREWEAVVMSWQHRWDGVRQFLGGSPKQ